MATIAFIGLGIMGFPMAVNLLKAGHQVSGYNRSTPKMEQLVARGGRQVADLAEAVQDADAIITMLPDSPDVEAVTVGESGFFAHAKDGALWIDNSTISPEVSRRLASTARTHGLRPLDAPVSGGEPGATSGSLSIMVGGESSDFDAAVDLLRAMGQTILHVGPSGAGQTVKAANQLIVAGNIALLAEALVFLEAHRVDTTSALKVLGGGLAGSKVLEQKGQKMLDRDFTPGFRAALHHKDLGILTSAAREASVVMPLGTLAAQLMTALVQQGDGGLDHAGLFKLLEQLSGRSPQ